MKIRTTIEDIQQ